MIASDTPAAKRAAEADGSDEAPLRKRPRDDDEATKARADASDDKERAAALAVCAFADAATRANVRTSPSSHKSSGKSKKSRGSAKDGDTSSRKSGSAISRHELRLDRHDLAMPQDVLQFMHVPPCRLWHKDRTSFDLAGLLAAVSLHQSSSYYRQVDLSTAFCITDCRLPDNPIVYVSSAFERLTGYPESFILGKNCRFLQGPHSDRRVVEKIGETVRLREERHFELVNYRADGSPFTNYLSIMPVHLGPKQEVTFFVGVQSDQPPIGVGTWSPWLPEGHRSVLQQHPLARAVVYPPDAGRSALLPGPAHIPPHYVSWDPHALPPLAPLPTYPLQPLALPFRNSRSEGIARASPNARVPLPSTQFVVPRSAEGHGPFAPPSPPCSMGARDAPVQAPAPDVETHPRDPLSNIDVTASAPIRCALAYEKRPDAWTVDDVCRWIDSLLLPQYKEAVRSNAIDGNLLLSLTEEELQNDVGIANNLHRKKLVQSIAMLRKFVGGPGAT